MAAHHPLIGRSAELRQIDDVIADTWDGGCHALVLEGPAGIGKSRLLHETAERATARGFDVARAEGDWLDHDRPFGVVVDALGLTPAGGGDTMRRTGAGRVGDAPAAIDALLHAATPLDAPVFAVHLAELRYRLTEELLEVVERWAQSRPLAIVVDDIQWADVSSVRALATIAARVRDLPVLVAVAMRTPAPGDETAVATGVRTMIDAGATHLRLGPLDPVAVDLLVDQMIEGPPSDELRAALVAAGGHPLSITALLEERAGRADTSLAPTGAIDSLVGGRLARLGANALDVARVAAVLGTNVELDDLLTVLDTDPLAVANAIDDLGQAHLVDQHGGRLWFRHDLVRDAVQRAIPDPVLRSLHLRCAEALTRLGRSASRIARHLVAGAADDATGAVTWLRRAAAEAGSRAPGTALELLREADRLVEADDPQRHALRMELVAALGWSGELDECQRLADTLLIEATSPTDRATLRRHLALCAFLRNRAHDAADQCLRISEESTDPAVVARSRAEAALAFMAAAESENARRHAGIAVEAGAAASSAVAQSLGRSVLSRLDAFALDLPSSLELATEAVAIANADGGGDAVLYHPAFFRMLTMVDLDRLDDVAAELARQSRLSERIGASWTVPLHHGLSAVVALYGGRLDDAAAEAVSGLHAVADVGSSLAEVWLLAVLAIVAVEQGDLDGARTHLQAAAHSSATQTPMLGIDLLALAQARADEAAGDRETARETLAGARELFVALGMPSCTRVVAPDLVRLALATGHRELASVATVDLEHIAERTHLPLDIAAASCARGQLERDPALLLEAVERMGESSRSLRVAECRELCGFALWEAGRREDAARMLASAEQTLLDAGASGSARRVGRLISDLGLRRPRGRRTVDGSASLTDRESTIADLVAEGLSNQAIADELGISKRTVETHLNRVYTKLGIRSRLQLALTRRH